MDKIFCYENFFDINLVDAVYKELSENGEYIDFIDKWGIWKGKLVSRQKYFKDSNLPNLQVMLDAVRNIFDENVVFNEINFQTLYLPWDIHSDWTESDGSESYYNILIPLCDAPSRTIIFDQQSKNTKHFYVHKEKNSKVENPIPLDIWQENLDMCWPEDREYLTINKMLPYQKRGQLMGFLRNFYHSSDNFHKRMNGNPKYFLQILVDKI